MEGGVTEGEKNRWFIGYLFSNLAGGIISPLIPLFVVVYLGLSVFYVGITTSIVSLASIPALIAWGNVSDSIKKRKIFILIGFVGSFAALIPISLAVNLTVYLFIQITFQILAMASVPVSTLIIMENVEKSKWPGVMSRFNLIASLGTLIGLFVGTILLEFVGSSGKFLVFLYELASFVYLIAALFTFLFVPEPGKVLSRKNLERIHSVRIVERIRFFPSTIIHFVGIGKGAGKLKTDMWAYLFCTCLLMTAFQLYFVPFPVYIIEKLHGTSFTVFVMYLLNSFFGTIAYRFTGRVVQKFGIKRVLAGALSTRVGLFSAMSVVPFIMFIHVNFLYFALAFYGVMGGLWGFIGISEVSYISRIAEEHTKGKAIGYYNSLNGLGQIIGGVSSGVIAEIYGYGVDFVIALLLVVAGSALIIRVMRNTD